MPRFRVVKHGSAPAPPTSRTAPVLDYPTAANPPVVTIHLPADAVSGDAVRLQWSQDQAFVSAVTTGTHTLVDAEISASTVTGLGIPTLSTGAPWYFRAQVTSGGSWSNTVAWNDAVAPVISTSAAQSQMELFALSVSLAANKTASWSISGGADQTQFEISGSTLRWFGNGSQNYDVPADIDQNNTYVVIVRATDLAGNTTDKTITVTTTAADKTPDAFSFTDVIPATPSTQYTSNTITVAGLTSSLSVPVTLTGSGTYSKNGGAFTSAAGTAQNGDTFALRTTSGSGGTSIVNLALSIGLGSDTWTVSNTSVTGQWTTSDGSSKHQDITVSGTPPLAATNAGFATGIVRTNQSASGKKQYELTVTTAPPGGTNFYFGIDDGATSFGPTGTPVIPGDNNNAGIVMGLNNSAWFIKKNSAVAQSASAGNMAQVGDVVTVEFDTSAGTVSFYRNGTQLGTTITGLGTISGSAYGFFGADSHGTACTLNTGQSAFTHTLSSGYTAFG